MGRIYMNLRFACLMVRFVVGEKKKHRFETHLGGFEEIDGFKRYSLERDSSHGWPSKDRGFSPKNHPF